MIWGIQSDRGDTYGQEARCRWAEPGRPAKSELCALLFPLPQIWGLRLEGVCSLTVFAGAIDGKFGVPFPQRALHVETLHTFLLKR